MDPTHAIWMLLVGVTMVLTGVVENLARRVRILSVVALGALLIGVSMIPRAELALVIAQHGRHLAVLTESTYTALVRVCAATCLLAPREFTDLLRRWPPTHRERRGRP